MASNEAPVVFVSHARDDKRDFAEPLSHALANKGIRPWLDKWEIKPGDSLVRRVFDEGISRADAIVVIIRLDDADMPPPVRHLRWINADRSDAGAIAAADEIAAVLHGYDARPEVKTPPGYAARKKS